MSNEIKANGPARPSWWSPRAGLWVACAFVAVGGYPYLGAASRLLADDKPLSLEAVKKEVRRAEMKQEKAAQSKDGEPKKLRDIRTLAQAADGTLWGGGRAGLFRLQEGQWVPVVGYPDGEARAIDAAADGSLLVTGRDGVHLLRDGAWTQVYEGEANTALRAADGTLYVGTREEGLKKRQPGQGEWTAFNKDAKDAPAGGGPAKTATP